MSLSRRYEWESSLSVGDAVIARWTSTVFGTRHQRVCPAVVTRVTGMSVDVRLTEAGDGWRAGQTVELPRALNRRHADDHRVDSLPVPAISGLNPAQRRLAVACMNADAVVIRELLSVLEDSRDVEAAIWAVRKSLEWIDSK